MSFYQNFSVLFVTSQYHLCSPMTRALLLSTYIKFVNLFPEIRGQIQDVFRQHSNLRSADAELQQRASEYLQLSIIASTDVLVIFIFIYLFIFPSYGFHDFLYKIQLPESIITKLKTIVWNRFAFIWKKNQSLFENWKKKQSFELFKIFKIGR